MNKIKVMSIFGTRPEATKMAPLILKMRENPNIEQVVAVTAQHRELLDPVLELFDIKPDYDLDIMQPGQTLASILTRSLERLCQDISEAKPDIVLVHGDTSTAFAGALAAYYDKRMIGHVEAGLRTYDKYSPYPEEMNRRLVSTLADLHFCPNRNSKGNLMNERITSGLYVTGNTAIDTVRLLKDDRHVFKSEFLKSFDFEGKRVIFMTAHRRENYGKPLENIMLAVRDIVRRHPDVEVIYAVHPSPAVRETAEALLGKEPRVHLLAPLLVDDSINLMRKCFFVLTDSGGLQEEAPALDKPVIVMRKETEREEAVRSGTAILAGTDRGEIASAAESLLTDQGLYRRMAAAPNPSGDGHAAERITNAILFAFGIGEKPAEFDA